MTGWLKCEDVMRILPSGRERPLQYSTSDTPLGLRQSNSKQARIFARRCFALLPHTIFLDRAILVWTS